MTMTMHESEASMLARSRLQAATTRRELAETKAELAATRRELLRAELEHEQALVRLARAGLL